MVVLQESKKKRIRLINQLDKERLLESRKNLGQGFDLLDQRQYILMFACILFQKIIFIPKPIQMGTLKPELITLILVLSLSQALHFGHPSALHFDTQKELEALLAQQSSFEKQINSLIGDLKQIQSKVNATNNTNEKVILLQNAITSEREKIHQLQNQIIPPFNLSKNSCKELTSEQKINLLTQTKKAREQLTKLQTIAQKIKSNPEVVQITSDIKKQETVLNTIESVIHSNCSTSAVLSPTVFQSNLYATNWILGRQTINDIVQQYYQRSRQNHNVTNCPIATPFFDGKQCVQCDKDLPLFNMQTSKCDICPYDTILNKQKRTCQQIPHYSNYENAQNYALDGATELPKPPANLTACPSTHPYFTNRCIKCSLPSYWSVKQNKCKDCPSGEVFDINNKRCEKPEWDTITYLQGESKWVTGEGNFTKVLEERAKLLENKTVKYNTCGKQTPYFDGVKCISCPKEFDLNTKKCTEAPQGMAYNPNLHAYVKVETNKTTNPDAPNLILPKTTAGSSGTTSPASSNTTATSGTPGTHTTTPSTNTSTSGTPTSPNSLSGTSPSGVSPTSATSPSGTSPTSTPANACPLTAPHYDGLACIKCPEPFPLFDSTSKKCVQCDAWHFYDQSTKACQKRPIVHISTNFSNIVATPKVSLSAYKQQLLDKVKNNGQSIVLKCKPEEYSNYTQCFTCKQGEKFNIQEKKCTTCNGTINPTTLQCEPLKTLLTDLNAANLIYESGATKDTYQKQQKEVKGPVQTCPADKPYSVKGLQCVSCEASTPYFDLKENKCTACPKDLYYDSVAHVCNKEINITNTAALRNYIQNNNYTIPNIKKQLEELSKTRKTKLCPENTPLASADGSSCSACANTQYIDLIKMKCIKGKQVTNIDALKKTGKALEIGTYNLASIEAANKKILESGMPTVDCPIQKPLFNGSECISCPINEYYNLQDLKCYTPTLVSNVNALAASKRCAEVDANTLQNLQKNIKASLLPTLACPKDKPLFDGKHCIYCPNSTYYSLKDNSCYTPQLVSNTDALSKATIIQSGRFNLANLIQSNKASLMPTQSCPAEKPLYNGKECVSCSAGEYYDLKTLQCIKERSVSNVDALNKTGKVIERGEYSLIELKKKIAAYTIPTKPCPEAEPLYNGSKCVACPAGEYYNLELMSCYKPEHHSNIDALNKTGKVVEVDGYTLQTLKAKIAKDNLPTKPCPAETPLLSANKCTACPSTEYYLLKTRSCYKPLRATNIDALAKSKMYVETPNHTLQNLTQELKKNPYPTVPCSESAPLFDGKTCYHCNTGEYFLLENRTCYEPKFATNIDFLAKSKLYVENDNHTLVQLNETLRKNPMPTKPCPEATPIWNEKQCVGCKQGEYYLLSNFSCFVPRQHTNVKVLEAEKRFIEDSAHTLKSINDTINKNTYPLVPCPDQKPLWNGSACMGCPKGDYYLLSNFTCYVPKKRTNVAALEKAKNYIEDGTHTLKAINQSISKETYPTVPCPQDQPVWNGTTCVGCPKGNYYLLINSTCYVPQNRTSYEALEKAKNYIENDNHTLISLKTSIQANKLPAVPCPDATPIWNGKGCVGCKAGEFYFLSNFSCYKPQIYSDPAALKALKNVVERNNATIANIQAEIKKQTLPVGLCDPKTPMYNGTACISCADPSFYDLQKKSCVNATWISNTDAIELSNNYLQGQKGNITSLKESNNKLPEPKKKCSADSPLFNGTQCLSCAKSLYNIETMKCAQCISTHKYDTKTRTCIEKPNYYPNLNNSKWIVSSDTGLQKLKKLLSDRKALKNAVECPNDQPHFNNNTLDCQVCPDNQNFDYEKNTCVSCGQGEEVDINTRKCAKRLVGVYQTSLSAKNLLFDGKSKGEYQEEYDNNKKTYPAIQDCPASTPFFDGFGCISCSTGYPLFSLDSKLCSNCPEGSSYVQKEHQCRNSAGDLKRSDPTMSKMYSSIF